MSPLVRWGIPLRTIETCPENLSVRVGFDQRAGFYADTTSTGGLSGFADSWEGLRFGFERFSVGFATDLQPRTEGHAESLGELTPRDAVRGSLFDDGEAVLGEVLARASQDLILSREPRSGISDRLTR